MHYKCETPIGQSVKTLRTLRALAFGQGLAATVCLRVADEPNILVLYGSLHHLNSEEGAVGRTFDKDPGSAVPTAFGQTSMELGEFTACRGMKLNLLDCRGTGA